MPESESEKEKSDKLAKIKKLLSDQNNRCVYTGDLLIPGVNASLDHIIPSSRIELTVKNELANLQWVNYYVNRMKWNNNHEEFLTKCLLISKKELMSAETENSLRGTPNGS